MNTNTFKYVTIFVVGAAVGALATYKVVKTKYEQIAQEEINSVKEVFSKRQLPNTSGCVGDMISGLEDIINTSLKNVAKQAKEKPEITKYASIIQKSGYTDYTKINPSTVSQEPEYDESDAEDEDEQDEENDYTIRDVHQIPPVLKPGERPYVISPDEFGEFDDYEQIGLNYFSDKVLTYDDDELIDDVDDIVGCDSLSRFGDYEDDSIFVRNDRLKCDYEILLDHRKYSDVIRKKPHQI
jgi:hypothetical protein